MKHYKLISIGLLTGVLLTSCKLGQKYTRPELNLPQAILAGGKDTLSVQHIKWWELYRDTVLQGLIKTTLEHNKDMLIAAARIKESKAYQRISKADLFPQIEGQIGGEREYDATPENTFEAKLNLTWEVDLWGKLRWATQESLAAYLQTVEGKRALQMTLIAQVAQAYFELRALDQELSIVRQTFKAREESVYLAKLRFEGGLTSETSYRQAQVELAKTKTLIPDLERKIKLKENEISLLTGHYPGQIPRGQDIVNQALPPSLPVGLPSTLLERRPDLRQAELKLKAANAKVGIAYTNLFPNFKLTGVYGLENNELSHFLKAPYWYIGGELLEPLFAMGKHRAKLKAAKAAYEQEVYAYQKSVLTAFKEVDNALTSYQKIKEIRESRLHLEEAAHSYMDLATLQYINGVISYLDVLDAQRGYFDAQISLNNAIRDELLSVVYLYLALGGGW
ncbi:efflux transporter outer membrane subunit [Gabonibacter chumensis]|uniref:efflux transporter outer membrane subunit n=1 Tax=Gabonibacter chumensis TaxID=2972474 RepID=UPI0025722E41|nr:efflux transporter outer membrane subunit [Gabonibacter chumensis]MCR9011885.1 efflux transporter outer membrane subunit [Gabonibacter chumensis]